jgi:5,10-methylenetetrahydrofolate reductase
MTNVWNENRRPRLSVEVEPPSIHSRVLEQSEILNFVDAMRQMAPFIDLISVTNRPTFRMSSISTMKLILSVLRDNRLASSTFPILHLTTRLSIHDTYNELLDARRLGIEYLLPVLGDPRGPKSERFFENSIDMLAFIKGVTNSELYSSHSLHSPSIIESNAKAIDDAVFHVGSTIDPNEYKQVRIDKRKQIREIQLELYQKRLLLGTDYFITQAVFDPSQALSFLDEIEDRRIPIGIGVIPPTFTIAQQIGVPLPNEIVTRLKTKTSKKKQYQEALQIAFETYSTLRENGIQWIHVYCLGRPSVLFSIIGESQAEEINSAMITQAPS